MSEKIEVEVTDEPDESRFVARVDGEVAGWAAYRIEGDHVVFTHTRVPDEFEGKGVGSRLARVALDTVRDRGQRVIPVCPFIEAYTRRHSEYDSIVDHDLVRTHREGSESR